MIKKIILAIALMTAIAGGTYQYIRISTYSYHLDKAEAALVKIEKLIEGKSPIAIIPTVYAQNSEIDEAAVAKNADTAVDEIGTAQDIVNDMSDSAEQTDAQNEVEETKKHAEETLSSAAIAVEGEDAKTAVSEAQESLNDIEAGNKYDSDATIRTEDPNKNYNDDESMRADHNDNDDFFDDDDDESEDKEIESEAKIDEAERTNQKNDSADNANTDTSDYAAEEAAAMARYQPWLDWEGNTPLPLETQKIQKDTIQPGSTDDAETNQKVIQPQAPAIDPALMQEAINQLMEQQ
ncbi:hypothetical protein KAI54_02495 [Candidatus Gracilibacteria bacterium]|nr:hypothetical protein [Candidatus Gracilibacteria bacterium]